MDGHVGDVADDLEVAAIHDRRGDGRSSVRSEREAHEVPAGLVHDVGEVAMGEDDHGGGGRWLDEMADHLAATFGVSRVLGEVHDERFRFHFQFSTGVALFLKRRVGGYILKYCCIFVKPLTELMKSCTF